VSLYERILGVPWVYDRLRPLVVGGFDLSRIYAWIEAGKDDIILDVGCGTGHAMKHLDAFRGFHGFDTDERALLRFRQKYPQSNVHLHARVVTAPDIERLRPNKVLLMGLLHHLSDAQAGLLLRSLRNANTISRVITWDTVYVRGKYSSNLLAWLDRGRYTRQDAAYVQLMESAGWQIVHPQQFCSGNGLALYFATCLTPNAITAFTPVTTKAA